MPKKPFGGKAKKAQLQAKRLKKEAKATGNYDLLKKNKDHSKQNERVVSGEARKDGRNRYALEFKKESPAELQASKERAMKPYTHSDDLTVTSELYFDESHDFPKRPAWDSTMSKEKLELNEQRIFRQYITKTLNLDPSKQPHHRPKSSKREDGSGDDSEREDSEGEMEVEEDKIVMSSESISTSDSTALSHFELNLETWRQLWRVLEKSHILLVILDVRYAPATFPPSLYQYIKEKGKQMIIVLNKIDLITGELAAAWKNYFQTRYPGIHIVFFTSFPTYNLVGTKENRRGMKIRKKKTNFSIVTEASEEIWDICNELYGTQVDLSTWKRKISGHEDIDTKIVHETYDHTKEGSGDIIDGTLVIGTVGHPNVGKSSLINSLMGKKVVSVSKTPGHTKHFQTIYLTKNVQLCDCPGLVFPSKVPKPLQVLMGSFPIAQLREPFSTIQFLAERLDLPRLLDVEMPEDDKKWTAFTICEQYALKKGFLTARTARPDSYRAANLILRFALDGRICLGMTPPNYKEADWTNHKDTKEADNVTAFKREILSTWEADSQTSDNDSEEEESGEADDSNDQGHDSDEEINGSDDASSDDEGIQVSAKNPFASLAKSP